MQTIRHAHEGTQGRVRLWDDEKGVQVIAVVLMVAGSVVVGAAPLAYLNMTQGVSPSGIAAYDVRVESGADGSWGTGDERVVMAHHAGQLLTTDEVQIAIQTVNENQVIDGAALGETEMFAERSIPWVHEMLLDYGTKVRVQLISERAFQEVMVQDVERTAGTNVVDGIPDPAVAGGGFVICHYPPGNNQEEHTLTVGSQSAVDWHMELHPDTLGPCP